MRIVVPTLVFEREREREMERRRRREGERESQTVGTLEVQAKIVTWLSVYTH